MVRMVCGVLMMYFHLVLGESGKIGRITEHTVLSLQHVHMDVAGGFACRCNINVQ